jgi:poly-gamma-glutamate capsule biosynthesis protein CapA/YwtB (metallophosphatase superfamily)
MQLLIAGDVVLPGVHAGRYGVFDSLRQATPDAQIVCNVECAITHQQQELPLKWATLKAEPAAAANLKGIALAVLGNNHIGDFGVKGAWDTVENLRNAGVSSAGYGENVEAAASPGVVEVGGIRVGVVATSCLSTNGENYASAVHPGVAPLSTRVLRSAVAKARETCDAVIVYAHWGVERTHFPVADQMRLARYAIDCGAHLVVGTHAHVIQGFEQYRGRWIFYGLGNCHFPDVRFRSYRPDGSFVESVLKQERVNRQSLAPLVRATKIGNGIVLELERTIYCEMGTDGDVHSISEAELEFDVEQVNRIIGRWCQKNGTLLKQTHEIRYRTRFNGHTWVHGYGSPPIDQDQNKWPQRIRRRVRKLYLSAIGANGRTR